jgi:hypothetical protein
MAASRFAALALLCLGCDRGDAGPPSPTTGSPVATAASPTASASAAPALPEAGPWRGKYSAKRADVTLPEGVTWGSWKKDDGARVAGDGQIDLEVANDGDVSGRVTGALGDLVVRGRLEDGVVAAAITPADPLVEPAMHGVLRGTAGKDAIEVELRLSSHDGDLVRSATAVLARR